MSLKTIKGKIFKLPKRDIDTDQIIPAKYLTKPTRGDLSHGCLTSYEHKGFNRNSKNFKDAEILIVGENFGCGSSREHAVWALQSKGIKAVVGTTFARIFNQNSIACGLPVIELPEKEIKKFLELKDGDLLTIDLSKGKVRAGRLSATFKLDPFDKKILEAGGLVGFAEKRYKSMSA